MKTILGGLYCLNNKVWQCQSYEKQLSFVSFLRPMEVTQCRNPSYEFLILLATGYHRQTLLSLLAIQATRPLNDDFNDLDTNGLKHLAGIDSGHSCHKSFSPFSPLSPLTSHTPLPPWRSWKSWKSLKSWKSFKSWKSWRSGKSPPPKGIALLESFLTVVLSINLGGGGTVGQFRG